ncbi:hypothetical protein [Lacinutrix salivirga]
MKKLLFILLVAISFNAVAQENMTEGVIASKMTMSSDNEQMKAQFAMIGDMNITTYFKNNKTRSELNNPMTGESTTIIDKDANKTMSMINNPMMGKKYAINDIDVSNEDLDDIKVTKGEKTKTILGYECQEYNVVMSKDGVDMKMDIYSTEKISAANQQTEALGDKFKGFPLLLNIYINQAGMDMKMTYEVTGIEKKTVADAKFDMTPPEGYEKTDALQGM